MLAPDFSLPLLSRCSFVVGLTSSFRRLAAAVVAIHQSQLASSSLKSRSTNHNSYSPPFNSLFSLSPSPSSLILSVHSLPLPLFFLSESRPISCSLSPPLQRKQSQRIVSSYCEFERRFDENNSSSFPPCCLLVVAEEDVLSPTSPSSCLVVLARAIELPSQNRLHSQVHFRERERESFCLVLF